MSAPARSNALQVVLTVLAVAAGGLLLLLVVLVAVGAYFFTVPAGGIDPTMAGLAPGKPAPAISAEAWANGEPEASDGKVLVVQGWFYDCPYCWQETPDLVRLHEKYGDRVSFVGLSTDPVEDVDRVGDFISKNGVKYPVGYGYDAQVTLARGFEAQAFPAVWVVGRDGTVLWNRSLEGKQSLEEAIEAALAAEAT